jgi:hypothetical protein
MAVRPLNCLLGKACGHDDDGDGGGESDRAVVT